MDPRLTEQDPQESTDELSAQSYPNLVTALLAAHRMINKVEKTKRNNHQGYNYASAEAIIMESRRVLNSCGLMVITPGWKIVGDPVREGSHLRYQLHVDYLLIHESGETKEYPDIPISVVVGAGKPYDKAEATALTYNLGYFLRGLLQIPRMEVDEDADDRNDKDFKVGDPKGSAKQEKTRDKDKSKDEQKKPEYTKEQQEEILARVAEYKSSNRELMLRAANLYAKHHGHMPTRADIRSMEQLLFIYDKMANQETQDPAQLQ
jgi:hypothetical protein